MSGEDQTARRSLQVWGTPAVVDWMDGDWPTMAVEPALSSLVDLVEVHHGKGPMLEVGCGTGRTYEALMRRLVLRPHGYVGADVAPAMISRARARYPDVDFRVADASALPFGPRDFGSVVCTDVLQHLPDLVPPIAEMLRVACEHVFLMLWLRKVDAAQPVVEPTPLDLPGRSDPLRLYQIAWSDEEVLEAVHVSGGRVLDFQVVDGASQDIGLVRAGRTR